MLSALSSQSRPLDDLVIVDNHPSRETEEIVQRDAPRAEYVPAPENLGPAGGIALGMQRTLARAGESDWLVLLDDDDPPPDSTTFATLWELATEMTRCEPRTGAVGLAGARFDRRKGQMVRVHDDELRGVVAVDYVAGNQFPLYSVTAVRAVGTFRSDLFFGFEELEYGLRIRDAGYTIYCPGSVWYEQRVANQRLGARVGPSRALGELDWRRYYALRNLICILRDCGSIGGAVRVTLVAGIAKPLANSPGDLRHALRHLRQNARACRDAWSRRMGRTLEPAQ
jgi:glycosyltransferase involved in cell wall biosynthesis